MISDQLFGAFQSAEAANMLAKAIVDTVREPLVVLDEHLRIVVASRSFYQAFDTGPQITQGCKIHEIDAGVWNITDLLSSLEKIVPNHGVMEGFKVELDFPRIGTRTMLLNARKVFYEGNGQATILLGLEDITERRRTDRALQKLLEQQDMLLTEMSHRVANSLQIIASILLMKARTVESVETRQHLQDAHRRVLSIASVQQQLQGSRAGEEIEVARYLSKLCETLAASMIGENRSISVKVSAGPGSSASNEAVSIGLIVTELVINALKHAFPNTALRGQIIVGYEANGPNWKLSVADDGIGMPDVKPSSKQAGLGTSLIKALAQQLDALVNITSSVKGTAVTITHATFSSLPPTSA